MSVLAVYATTLCKAGFGATAKHLTRVAAKIIEKEPRPNDFKNGVPGKQQIYVKLLYVNNT